MAAKVPTPEEVIALVGDGGMQQLIAQAQAQQAQAIADAHHALVEHAAAAGVNVAGMTDADVHMVAAAGGDTSVLGKVEASAMDFLPLSTAPSSVMSSPTASVAAVAAAVAASSAGGPLPLPLDVAAASASAAIAPTTSASASAAPIKRKSIPLSMKKEAIEWIMGPGKGIPSRAEKHFSALNWDVSASSFRKWWKNREKILSDASHKKRITGGGRKPYLEFAEEKLLVVVIQERAKKDRVTRKWIAKTAQHMFQRTNASFKASENWVTKFIRRNGLTLKRSYVTYEQQQQQTPNQTPIQTHMENQTETPHDDSPHVMLTHTGVGEMDDDGDDVHGVHDVHDVHGVHSGDVEMRDQVVDEQRKTALV